MHRDSSCFPETCHMAKPRVIIRWVDTGAWILEAVVVRGTKFYSPILPSGIFMVKTLRAMVQCHKAYWSDWWLVPFLMCLRALLCVVLCFHSLYHLWATKRLRLPRERITKLHQTILFSFSSSYSFPGYRVSFSKHVVLDVKYFLSCDQSNTYFKAKMKSIFIPQTCSRCLPTTCLLLPQPAPLIIT